MSAWAQDSIGPQDLPKALQDFVGQIGEFFSDPSAGPKSDRGDWHARPGFGGGGGPFVRGPFAGLFGGGSFGHGHSRGKGRAKGDVRSALIAVLADEPMHGYQIIQEIGRRSSGSWKPSPGSVYPTLQQLEDEGLVRAKEQDGRRVYHLTDEGKALAAERAEEFANLWQNVRPNQHDSELGDLVWGVASAFMHLAKTGTPQQILQAKDVLARTRTELYRILGEADAGAASTDDRSQHAQTGDES